MLKKCLLILSLIITPVFAQPPAGDTPPPGQGQGQRRPGRMRQILQQLNLSADQKSQLRTLMQSGVQGDERRQAVMKILTPEQNDQVKSLMARQSGPGAPGQGRPGRMRQMLQQLDLSDDQKSQMRTLMQSDVQGEERRQAALKILTPEQSDKLKSMMAQRQQQPGNPPQAPQPPSPPEP